MSPARIAVIASAMPLYGTCTISIPVSCCISSPARCTVPPTPEEPYLISPGCAFAYAISSRSDFAGSAGFARMSAGPEPTSVMALKSLLMSKGSFETAALLACDENVMRSV